MIEKFVKPFIQATIECFDTMVDVVPQPKNVRAELPPVAQSHICALIGLSGDAQGMVSLSFNLDVSLAVVSNFIGEPVTESGEEVYDAIGEILNIIAGAAKALIVDSKIMISLPSIMHGEKFFMSVPKDVQVVTVSFELPDIGEFELAVGLKNSNA